MREPKTIYRDPVNHKLIYRLDKKDGLWGISLRKGKYWKRIEGTGKEHRIWHHKFLAEEEFQQFVYDNGLIEEIMDEDLI